MQFEVWAPAASRVDLVVDGAHVPMVRTADRARFTVDADAPPGSRYGFSVDGGPVRPDPRSSCQPDGIHGASAVYDHSAFEWHDTDWRGFELAGAVLYELHVGTFSLDGTFDGAIEHLGHLVDLGITAVEIMPVVAASGSRGWGYDGVDLFAVHPDLGGPDALKRFVDACHGRGLGVLVDVVYNHLGPTGNYLEEFGPYFTDRHRTPWGDAVNFDGAGSAEVRRYLADNALMWLRDFHADGLRLDAVHAIVDESCPHILAEIGEAVALLERDLGRRLLVIAESDANDPAIVRPRPDGYGLDAVWSDDWHHALHTVLTGERDGYYEDFGDLDHLAKAIGDAWVYDGRWSSHRGREHGAPPTGVPADRFVIASQNHDQVGNRARGERLGALTSEGRLRIAAALLLTSPFVPMLFQGEEWGASTPFLYFTDHAEPELAQAVTAGRREEFASFGWDPDDIPDPQDVSSFECSVLDWSELDVSPHAELLRWHRALVALRRDEPDLHDPAIRPRVWIDGEVLGVERGTFTLLVNLGQSIRTLEVPECARPVLTDAATHVRDTEITLACDGVALMRVPARGESDA